MFGSSFRTPAVYWFQVVVVVFRLKTCSEWDVKSYILEDVITCDRGTERERESSVSVYYATQGEMYRLVHKSLVLRCCCSNVKRLKCAFSLCCLQCERHMFPKTVLNVSLIVWCGPPALLVRPDSVVVGIAVNVALSSVDGSIVSIVSIAIVIDNVYSECGPQLC